MKVIMYHPEQKFRCLCCGKCCTGWDIPIRLSEQQALSALKIPGLDMNSKKVIRPYRRKIYLLGKGKQERCIFMDAENLCRIHKAHGEKAKPVACRLYPFDIYTWQDGAVSAALRFDCPAVVQSEGREISSYQNQISGLADELAKHGRPAFARYSRGIDPGLAKIRIISETYRQIMKLHELPFPGRILAASRLLEYHADKRYAAQITKAGPEFKLHCLSLATKSKDELSEMIRQAKPLNRHRRMLFRYLISGYARIDEEHKSRISRAISIVRFMCGRGNLRDFQVNAPDSSGLDPIEVMKQISGEPGEFQLFHDFIASKLAAMHFCGSPCLKLSFEEGMKHLLLTYPVTHALAALHAKSDNRKQINEKDIRQSLMIVDHTFSRSRFFQLRHVKKMTAELAGANTLASMLNNNPDF